MTKVGSSAPRLGSINRREKVESTAGAPSRWARRRVTQAGAISLRNVPLRAWRRQAEVAITGRQAIRGVVANHQDAGVQRTAMGSTGTKISSAGAVCAFREACMGATCLSDAARIRTTFAGFNGMRRLAEPFQARRKQLGGTKQASECRFLCASPPVSPGRCSANH